MATTATQSRRFRPEQQHAWLQTRISTRPSPPKEARDERVRIAGRPLPPPLDVRLAQTQGSLRSVRSGSQTQTLREPEIVDLAASKPWLGRREVACPLYPPPPPPPLSRRLPRAPSRQSEMSFGILDYYIHDDEEAAPSPDLPQTPVVDPAIGRLDFGLAEKPERTTISTPEVKPGVEEDEMQLIPLSPRPFEEDDRPLPSPTLKKTPTYTLFPQTVKETSPSANRLRQVINDSPIDTPQPTNHTRQNDSTQRPRLLSGAKLTNPPRHRADTLPTSITTTPTAPSSSPTTIPSPSYHPRTSFSSRYPSTSLASTTPSSRRIPLRILSSSSTATTTTLARSSISTSPGSSVCAQQKPLLSRWSEDTALASPTTAAGLGFRGSATGCRESFGSLELAMGARGESYPACFFEDDEDDEVMVGGKRGGAGGRGRGWRGWFCCGVGGRRRG